MRQCRLHASVDKPGISAGGVKGNNAMRGFLKAGGNLVAVGWVLGKNGKFSVSNGDWV